LQQQTFTQEETTMTNTPITRLEDARALKRMGVPLNTPIEDRTFSEEYSEHPVFKSEQDEAECQLMACFLTERAMPFATFWEHAFTSAAAGDGEVLIRPSDIPQWFDPEE
jgi:hypothetical protein